MPRPAALRPGDWRGDRLGLVALAGLGAAFSLGSGVFSALGFVALAVAVLSGADAAGVAHAHLGWTAFGLAFAYLAASSRSRPAQLTRRGTGNGDA